MARTPWEKVDQYRWEVLSPHVTLWVPLTGHPEAFMERLVEIDGQVRSLAGWSERFTSYLLGKERA